MWACVMTLYHIIKVVKTDQYRTMYGDDPLARAGEPKHTNDQKVPNVIGSFSYDTQFSNSFTKPGKDIVVSSVKQNSYI